MDGASGWLILASPGLVASAPVNPPVGRPRTVVQDVSKRESQDLEGLSLAKFAKFLSQGCLEDVAGMSKRR